MSVDAQCVTMQKHIAQLAPQLAPIFLPRGYEALWKLDDNRTVAKLLKRSPLLRKRREQWEKLAKCDGKSGEDMRWGQCCINSCPNSNSGDNKKQKQQQHGESSVRVQLRPQWEIDFQRHRLVLKDLLILCESCHHCSLLESNIVDGSQPNLSKSVMDRWIGHFARVNYNDSNNNNNNSSSSPVPNDSVYKLQQVYALAYSLKTIASNFPSFTIDCEDSSPR